MLLREDSSTFGNDKALEIPLGIVSVHLNDRLS